MMKVSLPLYLFSCVIVMASCAVPIKSKKLQQISNRHKSHEGVIYHLPKNLINVTVTYTKIDSVLILNGKQINLSSTKVIIEKPIELSTSLVADTVSFQIKNDKALRGLFKDSDVSLEITPDGLLKTVSIENQDNSSDILQNGLKFGVDGLLGVGSLLTGLPLNLIPNPFSVINRSKLMTDNKDLNSAIFNSKDLEVLVTNYKTLYDEKSKLISDLNKQLDKLSESIIKAKTKDEIKVLEKQLKLLKEQIAYQNQMNRYDVKKEYIVVSQTFDPYANNNNKPFLTHIVKKPIIDGVEENKIPEASISIPFDKLNSLTQTQSSNFLFNRGTFNGLLVRSANYVDVKIAVDSSEKATKTILLAQAGDVTVIPFKTKVFGKSKMQLELYEETGTLKRYGAKTKGGGENLLNALNEGNSDLLDNLDLLGLLDQLGLEGILDLLNGQLENLGNLDLQGQLKELELRKQMAILEKQIQGINNGTIDPASLSNDELQNRVKELENLLKGLK